MSNKFDYHLIVIHILIYKILYLHVENVYNFLHYYYYYCKGRFWILSPKVDGLRVKELNTMNL